LLAAVWRVEKAKRPHHREARLVINGGHGAIDAPLPTLL
jgi:hypothetical protein